ANQPVVKSTDFEHGHERRAVVQALAGELLEEGVDLVRLRRDLPGLHDVTALVAERDRDLPCVLVDPQVQHNWVLLSGGWVEGQLLQPTNPRENRFCSAGPLFHRYHSRLRRAACARMSVTSTERTSEASRCNCLDTGVLSGACLQRTQANRALESTPRA